MTRAEALRATAATLAAAGIAGPAREAALLLRWACGLSPAAALAEPDAPVTPAQAAALHAGAALRARPAPLSHVTGRRAFWGAEFVVCPDVLDPRPETETLVALALDGPPAAAVIDLGVGSGCILLSLLAAWPAARGVGVDASAAALAVAARNAVAMNVADRLTLRRGDWLAGLSAQADLIVANPPYLNAEDMTRLQPELRAEPAMALAGGPDGLDAFRVIAPALRDRLRPGGRALLEHGPAQGEAVRALLTAVGLCDPRTHADLDGRPRVTGASRD